MENLGLDDECEEDSVTIVTKSLRTKAVGPPINDKIIDHFAANAEKLFIPKKIKDSGDWLVSHKEKG